MAPRITDRTRDALASVFNDLLSGTNGLSVLRVFDGTKPTDVDDGNGAGTQLASMTFAATAFNTTASPGLITLTSRLYDSNTDATGTPTWGLMEDAAGNKLMDFNIPGDLAVPAIGVGGELTISVLNLTVPPLSNSASGDITGDGFVGDADLTILLDNWGQFVGS